MIFTAAHYLVNSDAFAYVSFVSHFAEEAKKEESDEESDDDMGFGLFD